MMTVRMLKTRVQIFRHLGVEAGLGPNHITHHLPVPRLHRVGECDEAQVMVHEDHVEQGLDHRVRHRRLAVDVDHGGPHERATVGCPLPPLAHRCHALP